MDNDGEQHIILHVYKSCWNDASFILNDSAERNTISIVRPPHEIK